MRDDRLRLADTLEAIDQIEKYSQRGRIAFDDSELIRVWILHHLEIVGEAFLASILKRPGVRDLPELKQKVREIMGPREDTG
jgi:uncharacterized protein with HEPN domain